MNVFFYLIINFEPPNYPQFLTLKLMNARNLSRLCQRLKMVVKTQKKESNLTEINKKYENNDECI